MADLLEADARTTLSNQSHRSSTDNDFIRRIKMSRNEIKV